MSRIPPSTSPGVKLPEIGAVVGEHYKLVGVLGEGMFGKVYVAQRLDVPEHQVALKVLPRSLYASRNVERELVILATVGHPNVVQMKDHGTTDDYVWLTMPVYQGETLTKRLERGTLSPRQAYDVFLPIARGLQALHAVGLRHQDVKPDNIFLAVFGGHVHPILLDLGVAAEIDATFVAGTALYAAPEQLVVLAGAPSFAALGAKIDTYGLASTLLRALVGPADFPGEAADSYAELSEAQVRRTQEPLPERTLPTVTGPPRELIANAFRRWLALDPAARPSMSELAQQLNVLLEPDLQEERLFERGLRRQTTSLKRIRAAAVAMLAVGFGAAAFAYNKREALQLAAQLDAARQTRKESFDKLDTCVASYRMAREGLDTCEAERGKDQSDFRLTLEDVRRTGSSSVAERAREAQRYSSRLKTCEDDSLASRRAFEGELAEGLRQKAALAADRDEARVQQQLQKSEIAALVVQRDIAAAERMVCHNDLETCRGTMAQCEATRATAPVRAPRTPPLDESPTSLPAKPGPPGPPPPPGEPTVALPENPLAVHANGLPSAPPAAPPSL